ncbi:MAG: DNA-binding protein [Myxococcota bacterium]
MANSSVSDQVRSLVETFVAEMSDLIRRSAMETVQVALAGGEGPRRGRRGAPAGRRGVPALPAGRGGARLRAKGAKRSPDELEQLTEQLLAYVKSNPGQRIEQIAEGMGTSTKELNLPAKKLIGSKALKTRGHKRATQYFPR